MLRSGGEIVENVLLFGEVAVEVPALAEFAAAADDGDGVDAAASSHTRVRAPRKLGSRLTPYPP